MHSYFINQKFSLFKNTVWYSAGSFLYSFSSFVFLILISRVLGSHSVGIFSISWAISQLVYTVGLFGLRNFQVSELATKNTFEDYFFSKLVTLSLMFGAMFIYGFSLSLSSEKMLVTFLLTLLMGSEVLADLFSGYFQSIEKLAIAGQSYFIRIICYDITFAIVLLLTKNLEKALAAMVFVSYLWIFVFDFQIIIKIIKNFSFSINVQHIRAILITCFPIFLSAFLTNYIVNIPKNNIELYSTDKIQALYNLLSMPASIITLFVSFIIIPLYTKISSFWYEKKFLKFLKLIIMILFVILLFTAVTVLLGNLLGITLLTQIFGIDLSDYSLEFSVFLVGGGINSIINFTVFLMTVLKIQKFLVSVYLFVAVTSSFYTPYLVKNYAILGGSISYILSTLLLCLPLIIVTIVFCIKRKRQEEYIHGT